MVNAKEKKSLTIPATASLYYVVCGALGKAFTFISTPFFTRLLLPQEYGLYSLYVSWMGIFTVLSTLEISGSISYRAYAKFSGEADSFLKSAFLLQFFLSASFSAIYIVFSRQINSFSGLTTPLSLLLIFQIFLDSEQSLFLSRKKYEYRYKTVALMSVTGAFFSSFGAILLIVLFRLGAYARIYAPISVTALTVATTLILSRNKGRVSVKKMIFLLKSAIPMLPYYLSLSILTHQDKLLLRRLLGDEALGLYSVAYSTAFAVSLITTGIGSALIPWILRKAREKETEKIRQILYLVTKLVLTATLAFLTLIPFVYRIIAGEDYFSGIGVAYPIAAVPIFMLLSSSMTSCTLERGKCALSSVCAIIAAAIGYLAELILIGQIGIIGAALGALFSYFLLFLFSFLLCTREHGTSFIYVNKTFLLFLAFSVFALVIFMLKNSHASLIIMFISLILIGMPIAVECKRILLEK